MRDESVLSQSRTPTPPHPIAPFASTLTSPHFLHEPFPRFSPAPVPTCWFHSGGRRLSAQAGDTRPGQNHPNWLLTSLLPPSAPQKTSRLVSALALCSAGGGGGSHSLSSSRVKRAESGPGKGGTDPPHLGWGEACSSFSSAFWLLPGGVLPSLESLPQVHGIGAVVSCAQA